MGGICHLSFVICHLSFVIYYFRKLGSRLQNQGAVTKDQEPSSLSQNKITEFNMPTSRPAGQNIRKLALRRRLQAVYNFGGAGLALLFPFLVARFDPKTLERLSKLSESESTPPTTLPLPPQSYLIFVIIALVLVYRGVSLWRQARRADQGARGEEEMAQELVPLGQEGWQIEYGLWLSGGLGDADIVCLSPKGKAYVIDVKSHGGEVTTDGQQLYRRWGQQSRSFEKDFLERCLQQASQVKRQKGWRKVTPILAFSKAQVRVKAERIRGVYVVDKQRLVPLLRSLESPPPPSRLKSVAD